MSDVVPRAYPLRVFDDRTLPEGFDGIVCVWDIDKTYLATRFSSATHIARIPIEFAIDKRAIVGMPEVLRALRRGPGPGFGSVPLYFVTASPPQLGKVIARKMLLDGVEFDGITFKDWTAALLGRRPGRLREQVGFKMCALLEARSRRPLAREVLFGDDVESDAIAYALYARLVSRALHGPAAERELRDAGVKPDDIACALYMRSRLPDTLGPVERVFIHLEMGSSPARFASLSPLVMPVHGSFQLALALLEAGLVDRRAVSDTIRAVRAYAAGARAGLEELLADAIERKLVTAESARDIEI